MASIGPDNTPRPGRVLAATFVGVGAVTLLDRDRDVWMADRVRDEGNSSAREGLLQSRGARAGGDSSEEDGGSRSSRSRGRSSRSRSSRSRSSGRGNRTSSRTGSPQLDAAHRGNDPAAIAHRPDTPATDRSHPPSRSSPLPPSPTPHRSPSSPFDIPSPSLHNNAPSHLFSPPSPPLAPPPPPPPPPRAMHLPLATPFIARSSTDPSTASITPTRLLPLLHCPLCQPPRPLTAPRTLRCGHTLCAAHLSSHPLAAPCPLPACSPAPLPSPAAPAPSRAAAVPYVAAPPPAVSSPPRGTDVTVNKLLALVHRAHAWFEPRPADRRVPAHPHDPDERTDSEDDHAHGDDAHDPGPSSPPAHRGGEDDGSQPPHGPPPRPRSRSPPPRPRKRRRRLRPPRATHVPTPTAPDMDPHARLEKELFAELTCEICFGLLWQPVTTPCQHTFCAMCLHRALDHSSACPLCRQALPGYAYFQDHPLNRVVLSILLEAFPEAYAERGEALEAEQRDARLNTPVFVCQLSFPGMPTLLHFFEPRYRLMLRRCLTMPNPSFGMVPPPRTASAPTSSAPVPSSPHPPPSTGNEYGTMLEIRNVQMLPDGRSVVETWGAWRFRIVERGTLDGYVVARVERVDDWEEAEAEDAGAGVGAAPGEARAADASASSALVRGPSPSVPPVAASPPSPSPAGSPAPRPRAPTNAELMATCHAFLDQLREGTPWVVQHLNAAYVPMPGDPAAFSFWMGMLLPIDEHEKAKLLPIRSPRLRLRLVVHWIEQLQSNWARSYASASRLQVVLWWLRRLLIRVLFSRTWPYAFCVALLAVFVAQTTFLGATRP
ncbi:hypothetical protein AcV7_008013 [Taiwanofungus camphoratus]|nr:hypothetical protein AcV7_008013 [Antrodia cinnamomea]